jgi:hypothetical protein
VWPVLSTFSCYTRGYACSTDPAIHTASGQGFGGANLGQPGILAFFGSHRCNAICRAVGLKPFLTSPAEQRVCDCLHQLWAFDIPDSEDEEQEQEQQQKQEQKQEQRLGRRLVRE